MAQFDVHRSPTERRHEGIPYLLNIQADLLDHLLIRVVVPLLRADGGDPLVRTLNPRFELEGGAVIMMTQLIGGMPVHALGTAVDNLADHRAEIIAAIDMLIMGI